MYKRQDVYTKYFEGRKLLDILGLGFFYENYPEDLIDKNTIETFFNKIKNDNEFVKKNKLESIRETSVSYTHLDVYKRQGY